MSRLQTARDQEARRKHRVRSALRGNGDRLRLSVNLSNKNISAQIIDDSKSITIVSAGTINLKSEKGTMTERAALVGKDIAKKAKAKKVSKVTFDRGSKLYHGRIKALAEAARQEGLEF